MIAALVLVATPIGNLGDITIRAARELRSADAIACEDTRRTRALLSHLEIRCPPLIVVNDHTEAAAARDIVRRIEEGRRVALISDAGSPGISDPGERLVRAALAAGVAVEVIPGASAAIAALTVSGLPSGRFVFEGFLPRKGAARSARVEALRHEERTAIIFEAPHRIAATIGDLVRHLGESRRVAVCRELTKLHEEVFRGTIAEAGEWAAREPAGEMVIVLEGAAPAEGPGDDQIVDELRRALRTGATKRDAVVTVTDMLRVPRRRVYDLVTRLSQDD